MNFLEKIRPKIERRVSFESERFPLVEIKKALNSLTPPRDWMGAFSKGRTALIAEVKRSSPSTGVLKAEYRPEELARLYERAGAAAMSVLTEGSFFGGEPEHLAQVKAACQLPVLRKDFIIEPYQVYQSRLLGADAVLLIAEMLEPDRLREMLDFCRELGMGCLVEAHDQPALEKAVKSGAKTIGINNRNLATLKVDLEAGLRLLPLIPEDRIKVSESGISTREQIIELEAAGADAFLVGGAILKAEDPAAKIKELLGR